MDPKKPWQSKTNWINLIIALAAFFPAVTTALGNDPQALATAAGYASVAVLAVINIGLRFLTKKPITWKAIAEGEFPSEDKDAPKPEPDNHS